MRKIDLCMLGVLLVSSLGAGPTVEAVYVNSVPIEVTASQVPADDRGTEVDNMRTLVVDYAGTTRGADTYNILIFIDGQYTEEFKGQTLPHSFKRDFRGLTDGAHEVRIDLEAADLSIVGRKTVVVNVAH